MAIDSRTGAFLGSFGFTSYGLLAMSPDHAALYVGNRGVWPATLQKFDVSTPAAELLQSTRLVGSNGRDLKVSRDGTFLCFPASSGNGSNGYNTRKISANDLDAFEGVFETGAYPGPVALSGDDAILYHAIYTQRRVSVFDTRTLAEISSIPLFSYADMRALALDNTGALLFVGRQSDREPAPSRNFRDRSPKSGKSSAAPKSPQRLHPSPRPNRRRCSHRRLHHPKRTGKEGARSRHRPFPSDHRQAGRSNPVPP